VLQDPSTHARESISKLECLYEASELGSKQRAVAYDKYVSLKHRGAPSLRSCVNDDAMMLVCSSCVEFKSFETSIPNREGIAVPATFDDEHLRRNGSIKLLASGAREALCCSCSYSY